MQIAATSAEVILTGSPREDPAKLEDAARQFEALLIGGMLKSARESDGEGWMGSGTDGATDTALSMADEQLAQAMASRGGLGLAKLILDRLSVENENTTSRSQGKGTTAATIVGTQAAYRVQSGAISVAANGPVEAQTKTSQTQTAADLPVNVALSIAPNPFNPDGGMHFRPDAPTTETSTAPVTAPGSYGVVVAGPGQSYLPFAVNYLSGLDPDGGHYGAEYVDFSSAQQLAQYTGIEGAKVVISCGGGFLDQTFPGSYGVQIPSGQVLDAGGLARLYRMYPKDYADLRIQQAVEKARPIDLGTSFYSVDQQGDPLYSSQYLSPSGQNGDSESTNGTEAA
jgi:Rod binding domain-containing protein